MTKDNEYRGLVGAEVYPEISIYNEKGKLSKTNSLRITDERGKPIPATVHLTGQNLLVSILNKEGETIHKLWLFGPQYQPGNVISAHLRIKDSSNTRTAFLLVNKIKGTDHQGIWSYETIEIDRHSRKPKDRNRYDRNDLKSMTHILSQNDMYSLDGPSTIIDILTQSKRVKMLERTINWMQEVYQTEKFQEAFNWNMNELVFPIDEFLND